MINVYIDKSPGDVTISLNGHAGQAEHGKDIVCSAISAIIYTCILGIEMIEQSYPQFINITRGKNNDF